MNTLSSRFKINANGLQEKVAILPIILSNVNKRPYLKQDPECVLQLLHSCTGSPVRIWSNIQARLHYYIPCITASCSRSIVSHSNSFSLLTKSVFAPTKILFVLSFS